MRVSAEDVGEAQQRPSAPLHELVEVRRLTGVDSADLTGGGTPEISGPGAGTGDLGGVAEQGQWLSRPSGRTTASPGW
ncbi:hypothetical protein GCM10012279_04080 [Micromonospora yangpuensis]|nr:hypothetical protein GCM10012279_04080 [Micromonospora yangpuensis]